MGTAFFLVRHGAYPLLDRALGGRADHALSEKGRQQAARVAAVLAGRSVTAVAASPVRRARETAEIIAARLGIEVRVDDGFAEVDFGAWTGAAFDTLDGQAAWRAWNVFRSFATPPDGETMLAVQARAIAAMLRLAAQHPGGEVVVVTHADIVKALLAHVLGSPLDLLRRMEIGAGSISRLVMHDDDAAVELVNFAP